jgi:hypothetical protein
VNDLVHVLRVTLDPHRCGSADRHLCVAFPDGAAGLHVRNGVAVPTDGSGAELVLGIDRAAWGSVIDGRAGIAEVLASGDASASDDAAVAEFLSWFDLGR